MINLSDIERLTQIGQALYGRTWQAQVCDLLDVDGRRVAHWIAGTRQIPPGIWPELASELHRRGKNATELAKVLQREIKSAKVN